MARSETEAKALDPVVPSKGLNLTKQPEVIDPSEGSDGLNVVFADGCVLRRPGTTKVVATAFTGGAIRHIARHITRAGTEYLIVVTPTKTYIGVTGAAAAPTVTSLAWYESGKLTITGTNFGSSKASGDSVKIDTVETSAYYSWSPTEIVVASTASTDADGEIKVTKSGLTPATKTQTVYITSAIWQGDNITVGVTGSGFGATQSTSTIKMTTGGVDYTEASGGIVMGAWGNTGIVVLCNPVAHYGYVTIVVGANTAICFSQAV